jgi:hypothetical protein
MDMVTTKEALELLRSRGLEVPYPTLALWVREGRFEGAELDESNPRGSVWYIPRTAVENFELPERGRPPLVSKPPANEKTLTGDSRAKAKASSKRGGKK